jgi:ABC-2 type transport system ATP-binding protein
MLEVERINKSYFGNKVLKDISLTAKEGQITGLLGPNGAGKTTLIRIINRIIEQDNGAIRLNGDLIQQKHLPDFGYLPEERGLYRNMTVKDQGLFLGRLKGLTKKDALQNLNYWLEKLNISEWSNKRIEELSKGMAQKVQLIYTFLHDPKILILDEPFSGFDPINIDLMKKELNALKKQNKIILLSTHNMKSVEELCDKAILIHQGEKVLEGNIEQLKTDRKEGTFAVKFKGNMIAFANALWIGYEITDKTVHADDIFTVELKMRGENEFNDLLKTIMPHVKIISAYEVLPSMEKIFVDSTKNETTTIDE